MISIYYLLDGQKFQSRGTEKPNLPDGAIEITQAEYLSSNTQPDYEAFFRQCYEIPGFTIEVATKPGWLVVQQRLEKEDYTNALAVFGSMGVPQAIIDAMLPLAVANDLPQPVIDALSS
jgi:hypothetical protein